MHISLTPELKTKVKKKAASKICVYSECKMGPA